MRKKWRLNIKIPTRSSDKVWKFGVSSYNDKRRPCVYIINYSIIQVN